MKKVLKILSGVLFVALLVGTFWFLWRKTRPVKILYAIVQPATDTLKQYVVATGKVQPRDEVEIKPQISGIISDVYKEAGETVRQGEVIATVKVVPEMGQLSSAESRVSVAEISLAQVRREYDRTAALHEKGIVSGDTLHPDAPCTRAMTVTYLWRLAGSPSASASAFRDVKSTDDYAAAVAWGAENGIIKGITPTIFGPYNTCTPEGVDECVSWGDYFYMEALTRLTKDWELYW